VTKENQGIGRVVPPPVIVIALTIVGFGLQWHYALSFQNMYRPYWLAGGILLIALSGFLALWARLMLLRQKTPIVFNKPTTAIVRSGPFSFSRNPLYLSLVMLYAGIGIVADAGWFIPLLVVFVIFVWRVILREERYLEHAFGAEYMHYKRSVRRWL